MAQDLWDARSMNFNLLLDVCECVSVSVCVSMRISARVSQTPKCDGSAPHLCGARPRELMAIICLCERWGRADDAVLGDLLATGCLRVHLN